jgi:hypothetical protein
MADLQRAYREALGGKPSRNPLIEMVRMTSESSFALSSNPPFTRLFHRHSIRPWHRKIATWLYSLLNTLRIVYRMVKRSSSMMNTKRITIVV